jgi:hypothetical protein
VVSGVVASQSKESRAITLILKGSDGTSISCKFDGNGVEGTKTFAAGDTVKLYGEFMPSTAASTADRVNLANCRLIVD